MRQASTSNLRFLFSRTDSSELARSKGGFRSTLAGLEAELAEAREARERVGLVYHIPPGIDGYATLRRGSCPGAMIPMWDQAHAAAFLALLKRYAGTVTASFAGHTHMDDFRLIG